jgi:hypothetical protein
LSENKERFHAEQQQVLRVGLETASYVHTDDTGARHQGKNGYCTVIGNWSLLPAPRLAQYRFKPIQSPQG